jgi:hypothetical protein
MPAYDAGVVPARNVRNLRPELEPLRGDAWFELLVRPFDRRPLQATRVALLEETSLLPRDVRGPEGSPLDTGSSNERDRRSSKRPQNG